MPCWKAAAGTDLLRKPRENANEKGNIPNLEPIRAKLLIFDLDGTLADTVPAIAEAVNLTLDAAGFPRRDEEYVRRSVGNGALVLSRRVMPPEFAENTAALQSFYRLYDQKYTEVYDHTREPYPHMTETLSELKRRGYTLSILSNKQHHLVTDLTEKIFPQGLFSAAQGLPEGRAGKPDPALCLEMLSSLGFTPDEAVMIGDGETDVAISRRAGLVCPVCVTWGYRSREQLTDAGCRVFIDDPRQLAELFPPLK